MYTNLLVDTNNGIATITLNRPKQLNALNKETITELSACLDSLKDDKAVRVLIITGSGEKSFVAGADIKEFADFNVAQGKELAANGQEILFNKIENYNKPVIAAVNGFALGGGLELAMSCHIRVASDNARLGLPETSLGVIPGYGGTQRLAQLAGKGKAMEMVLTAGMIKADEAQSWGIVNKVVPQEELMATCEKMASKMMANSPNAQTVAINVINAGLKTGVDSCAAEIEGFGKCFGTPEFVEGTTAFMEKRKANY